MDGPNGSVFTTSSNEPHILTCYCSGELSVGWDGPWSGTLAGKSLRFQRIGNLVSLSMEGYEVASVGVASIVLNVSSALPVDLRPVSTQTVSVVAKNNSVPIECLLKVDTSGIITISNGLVDGTPFVALGNAGIGASNDYFNISYFAA